MPKIDLTEVRHWRTFDSLLIKESPLFTEIIQKLMPDELYIELQEALIIRPDMGVLIPGGGGLRKMRWKKNNSGKRGGVRIIYYWITRKNEIYMLYAYEKNKTKDLTQIQIKQLRKLIEED